MNQRRIDESLNVPCHPLRFSARHHTLTEKHQHPSRKHSRCEKNSSDVKVLWADKHNLHPSYLKCVVSLRPFRFSHVWFASDGATGSTKHPTTNTSASSQVSKSSTTQVLPGEFNAKTFVAVKRHMMHRGPQRLSHKLPL